MKKTISIIGCGAVGAAQIYHLVEKLIDENLTEFFEILVFEKSSNIGHGVAYANDDNTNILNRNTKTMSLIHHKPGDFFRWLKENSNKWKEAYTIKSKLADAFVPRSLFGAYIEDIIQQTIQRARKHNLKISFIHDEVINIIKESKKYKLETKSSWSFYADINILTIGNLSSNKFGNYLQNDRFFPSPYPTKNLAAIPSHAKVGIIGSRLSAIDAALALSKNQHKGEIAFIARNGYLPSIRSPFEPHELKVLTSSALKEILNKHRSLRLKYIVNLLIKEVSLSCGKYTSLSSWIKRPTNPEEHFKNEFKRYKLKETIVWQSVLIAFNNLIEEVWHELNEEDRLLFKHIYKSKWLAYRVAIPSSNARKIYNLYKQKQLSLITHFKKLDFLNGKFLVTSESLNEEFDYIIDGTGFSDDISLINSTLLSNLIKVGLIKSHEHGGLDVDFSSSRVIKKDGEIDENFYAIGNLTSGVYLFTSVLELNVKHAFKISNLITSCFLKDFQNEKSISTIPNDYIKNETKNLACLGNVGGL